MSSRFQKFLEAGELAAQKFYLSSPSQQTIGTLGSRLGNVPGSSMDFLDHRSYYPGDDIRRIDWNAFARSDKIAIKLFREEVMPHVDILLDTSRSMDLPGTKKSAALLGLAALFAGAAVNADFSFAVWVTTPLGCVRVDNGGKRPSSWDTFNIDSNVPPTYSLRIKPPKWKPLSLRIFLSDLLWPGDPIELFHLIGEKASQIIVVQIMEIDETQPSVGEMVQLIDSETGETLDIFLNESVIKKYLNTLTRHLENWRRASQQMGAIMTGVIAEHIVADWQLIELTRLGVLQLR